MKILFLKCSMYLDLPINDNNFVLHFGCCPTFLWREARQLFLTLIIYVQGPEGKLLFSHLIAMARENKLNQTYSIWNFVIHMQVLNTKTVFCNARKPRFLNYIFNYLFNYLVCVCALKLSLKIILYYMGENNPLQRN